MTREEEIQKAAKLFYASSDDYTVYKKGFEAGAEWADQHPRKGLWGAEKVCEILREIINSDTIVQYLIFDDENIDFDSELFFDDLHKAMEE